MCIYLVNRTDLHYNSGEHIIPAGLGGIKKLPLDYVSLEFNNMFSKYEEAFMRSSILSFPRQILGPGKRGSLALTKVTKSKINVFKKSKQYSLGYVALGKPIEIPHIVLNTTTGEFSFSVDKNTNDVVLQDFKDIVGKIELSKTRHFAFSDLPENIYLFGYKKGIEENFESFIASKEGGYNPFNKAVLKSIAEKIPEKRHFSNALSGHVRIVENNVINIDYFRCCAKIAFNCLADIKGKDFVMSFFFDPIRNWIVNSGGNHFVSITEPLAFIKKNLPEDAHYVIISGSENGLFAYVSFYNHYCNVVKLTDQPSRQFSTNGRICNWKTREEYSWREYLEGLINVGEGI